MGTFQKSNVDATRPYLDKKEFFVEVKVGIIL